MTIYRNLLAKGFFPKELPPSFYTEQFAHYAVTANGRAKIAGYTPPDNFTQCAEYNLGKPGGHRRPLGIPNPFSYAHLANLVAANFKRLLKKAGKSKCSRSRPVYDPADVRALRTLFRPPSLGRERAIVRAAARYVLRVDVSQVFPSLYTHAVGWAIDPKLRQKKYWHTACLGKDIDKLLMNSQGKISQGIPVGPDLSFLFSEIVLCQVDEKLGLSGQNAFRWVDDYEVACRSIDEAEGWLAGFQRELARFRLRVNPKKIGIQPLPQAASDGWQSALRDAVKRSLSRPQEMIAFFDEAFRLREKHPDTAVMNYSLGLLFRAPMLSDHAANVAQSLISQSMLSEPGCVQKALALLTFWSLNGMPLNYELVARTITEIVLQQRQRGLSSDVAWGLSFCLANKLELATKAVKVLEECDDNCIALLALHMQAAKLLPTKFKMKAMLPSVKTADLEGPDWLFLYEGEHLGFIKPTPSAKKHPVFGDMLAKDVGFYRLTMPPYANVIHPGGAPEWLVQKWLTNQEPKSVDEKGKPEPKAVSREPSPLENMITKDTPEAARSASPKERILKLLDSRLEKAVPDVADEENDLS